MSAVNENTLFKNALRKNASIKPAMKSVAKRKRNKAYSPAEANNLYAGLSVSS